MQKISKKHPCRVNTIQTDCVITPFFERKKGVLVSGCEVESTVWDTGATNTIISSAVVDDEVELCAFSVFKPFLCYWVSSETGTIEDWMIEG